MGAAADGLQHQQAGAEEQPSGRAGRPQVVRRLGYTTPAFQIHDLRANAHYAFW